MEETSFSTKTFIWERLVLILNVRPKKSRNRGATTFNDKLPFKTCLDKVFPENSSIKESRHLFVFVQPHQTILYSNSPLIPNIHDFSGCISMKKQHGFDWQYSKVSPLLVWESVRVEGFACFCCCCFWPIAANQHKLIPTLLCSTPNSSNAGLSLHYNKAARNVFFKWKVLLGKQNKLPSKIFKYKLTHDNKNRVFMR